MTTASLELSKQLYELSKWDSSLAGGGYRWCEISPGQFECLRLSDAEAYQPSFKDAWFAGIPAPDLGFLIRKLPKYLDYNNGRIYLSVGVWWAGGWQIHYGTYDLRSAISDIPEDALVLLAIKLFEAGILKR